jgi:hypothetical protein
METLGATLLLILAIGLVVAFVVWLIHLAVYTGVRRAQRELETHVPRRQPDKRLARGRGIPGHATDINLESKDELRRRLSTDETVPKLERRARE